MPCDRMTGLNLRLVAAQYSRASMFTLRWSRPSWQISACAHAIRPHVSPCSTRCTWPGSPCGGLQQLPYVYNHAHAWRSCQLKQATACAYQQRHLMLHTILSVLPLVYADVDVPANSVCQTHKDIRQRSTHPEGIPSVEAKQRHVEVEKGIITLRTAQRLPNTASVRRAAP